MSEITKNQVKHVRLLKQKKYRQQCGEFVVEGEKNVAELLSSSFTVNAIFATSDWENSVNNEPVTVVTTKELSQISNLTNPNKVVALAQIPETKKLTAVTSELTLCLDTINDPGNLGTIIRTADWFGIKQLVCSPESVDCYNPKVVQATKGSLFNVSVSYQPLDQLLEKNTLPVYGASLDGEDISGDFKPQKPCFLLMGSESHGINTELEKWITNKIKISKKGKAESLNVAVATSILLHQFTL